MRVGFMNESSDVQWLKETALRGIPLPAEWGEFASFVLQGNEDAPYAVNLYRNADPLYSDNFYRVRFVNDSGAAVEACEYSGADNQPVGGLARLD